MKIIGIDPGSSGAVREGSAVIVFENVGNRWNLEASPKRVNHMDLRNKIEMWTAEEEPNTLILWDAPLTGPREPGCKKSGIGNKECYNQDAEYWQRDFTMRGIEQKLLEPLNTVTGISVMGYARCPHMAITRNLVGLPILGNYDCKDGLPFELQTTGPAQGSGKFIIETHPAVALWAWLQEQRGPSADWKYKTGSAAAQRVLRRNLFILMLGIWESLFMGEKGMFLEIKQLEESVVQDDNIFDALIAAVLGWCFVQKKGARIFGSKQDGAMLLPDVKVLRNLLENSE